MAKDFLGTIIRDDLPDPAEAPELFESLLTRRVSAFVIDAILLGFLMGLTALVAGIAGFFTFFLAWLAMPVLLAVVFVAYYALSLGSPRRATPGMAVMDLVATPTRSVRLDGWMAVLHVALYWISVSVLTPFILLLALFTPRRQTLHDIVAGVLIVRRSPMERHWRAMAA